MQTGPDALWESWLWLAGSFLVAVLWAQLTWALNHAGGKRITKLVRRIRSSRLSPWAMRALRLLYYLAIPLGALIRGPALDLNLGIVVGLEVGVELPERLVDWAQRMGLAAALALGAWVLLALGWSSYRRALLRRRIQSPSPAREPIWVILREAAYHEAHWAFYRHAPAYTFSWLGGLAADRYWAAWCGLAIVALEALLNPAWRRQLADPERAPVVLQRASLAIVSAVLFGLTNSLLLAVAVHWAVWWGLQRWASARPLPAPAPELAAA